MARSHGDPGVFPRLQYTETNDEWVLLRGHAARGQIRPDILRRMTNSDLEYLAGMPNLNPTQQATSEQWAQEVKVVENAIRAARVLQRRSALHVTLWSTLIATVVGVVVGGIIVKVGSQPSCELRTDPQTLVVTASC